MAELKLLPCPNPWCESHQHAGGTPDPENDIWMYGRTGTCRVQCPSCSFCGPHRDTEPAAITAWNTRPATSPITGEADTLAAAINQNDAMRQELAHVGNLLSDLARAMRVDQANADGSWPDLAGRIQKLISAALPLAPREGWQDSDEQALHDRAGEILDKAAAEMEDIEPRPFSWVNRNAALRAIIHLIEPDSRKSFGAALSRTGEVSR